MKKTLFAVLAALVLLASCTKESSEKKILTFKFATPEATVTISESAKTITAVVPKDTDVTALIPLFTLSPKATAVPASGATLNFTNPVTILVTAEDGSSVEYKVTVTFDQNGGGGGGNGGGNGGGGGGGNDPTDPTTWSGSIDANTTWKDLGLPVDYVIDGWIYITGNALLTIEPGVTIMFANNGSGFDVGENAGLKMVGTAEKPIILEGPQNNPNNGSWYGIRVNSKRTDNQFEYVQFLRGGSGTDYWDGVVRVSHGFLGMKNCIIDGSLGAGLVTDYKETQLTAFENNTIKNCATAPWLSEYLPALCKNIGTGNTFTNNAFDVVVLHDKENELTENLTLPNLGYPYYFLHGARFGGEGTTFTIEPGVEILVKMYEEIVVEEKCRFVADGSFEKQIVFDCFDDDEAWSGIIFKSQRTNNVINYCRIRHCGTSEDWSTRSCLFIWDEAKLNLTNNLFGPSKYNGVGIDEITSWGTVTHSNNSFVLCDGGEVWIEDGGEYDGVTYNNDDILHELP